MTLCLFDRELLMCIVNFYPYSYISQKKYIIAWQFEYSTTWSCLKSVFVRCCNKKNGLKYITYIIKYIEALHTIKRKPISLLVLRFPKYYISKCRLWDSNLTFLNKIKLHYSHNFLKCGQLHFIYPYIIDRPEEKLFNEVWWNSKYIYNI